MTAHYETAANILSGYDPINEAAPVTWSVGPGWESVELGPETVTLIGAAPGTGKTALVMQWLFDAMRIDRSLRCLVANVEMSHRVLLDRQLSRLSGIDLTTIRKRQLMAHHALAIADGMAEISEVADRLAFLRPPFDMPNVIATCDETEPDIVVLDYIQRFDTGDVSRHGKRESLDAVADTARRLADCGCAVVCVSAVSRQRDNRGNAGYGNLNMASLKDSGELEFTADAVLVMQRYPDMPGIIDLGSPKNRHGETWQMRLRFDGSLQEFTQADGEDVISAVFPEGDEV